MGRQLVTLKNFFSQKTSRTLIHQVQRAHSFSKVLVRRARMLFELVFHKKMALSGMSAMVLLLSLLVPFSPLLSEYAELRKLETINVLPGNVDASGWEHVESVLIQDVGENGLFGDFMHSNSTYPTERSKTSTSDDIYHDGADAPPETSEERVIDDENPQVNESETGDIHDEGERDEVPEDVSIPQEDTPSDSTESTQESEPSPIVGFWKRAIRKLPFAHESLITPVEVEEESGDTTETVPVVGVEDESLSPQEDTDTIPEDTLIPDEEGAHVEDHVHDEEVIQEDAEPHDLESASLPSPEFTSPTPHPEDVGEVEEVTEALPVEVLSPMIFSDFGIPPLLPGQLITNAQLRLSLGAFIDQESQPRFLTISYRDGEGEWIEAGSVPLMGEVSNALNRGYFLFALPQVSSPSFFDTLSVRVSLDGNLGDNDALFVDAVWLEIDTEFFDRSLLSKRLLPEAFEERLMLPERHELLSDRLDFVRGETPEFVLKYLSQRNPVVGFFRSLFGSTLATVKDVTVITRDGIVADATPRINMTEDGLWTIQFTPEDSALLQPGTYTMELTIDEGGKEYHDAIEFQWGMLALNPTQTEYEMGDTATISFGALSSNGNTVCDANLVFYVFAPDGTVERPSVSPSGQCLGNTVVDKPDYTSSFVPHATGTYELYVEHVGASGEVLSHSGDTILVRDVHTLWIERHGPTRIYPPALYPMEITVHARGGFVGTLTDVVPDDFVIYDTDAHIHDPEGGVRILSWELSLAPGETRTLSYSFDAPDISPFLYTLGPAELQSASGTLTVTETLPSEPVPLSGETITTEGSDAQFTMDDQGEVPGVPPEEEGGEEDTEGMPHDEEETESHPPEEESSPVDTVTLVTTPPSSTDDTETEEVEGSGGFVDTIIDTLFGGDNDTQEDASSEQIPEEAVEEKGFFESIVDTLFGEEESIEPETLPSASSTPEEVVSPQAIEAESDFTEHRRWQIASDATGSMLLYWASTTIPSGWTCVSCLPADTFYQRFVLGSSTPGVTGGATTHTHTASGAISTNLASTSINNSGGNAVADPTHTHNYTPVISTDSHLPPYRQMVLIQHNSAGSPATIPTGAIALFDASVPSGWTSYTAQDGYFTRSEATTTIGTTGGSATHSHTVTGNTGGPTVTFTAGAGDNAVTTASVGHTHSVNTVTDNASNEPPYIEAIFGRLGATSTPTDAMIAMWTDAPPTGWSTVSSTSEPFVNRFVKASTTYGGTGGSPTSTHANITGVVTGAPNSTQTRDQAPIDDLVTTSGHTHTADITNFSVASILPPYRTAIFAKRGTGGAPPQEPTIHLLFDNEYMGTSTPYLEFTGEDLDGADTLVYQIEWDDDKQIDTSPLGSRTSDNETGCSPNCFTNTVSGGDTNPFNDNERIRFSFQSALTSGTTYYWRVRVKETVGDTWSDWSTIRSFTYGTGIALSEWYQTEGAQFEIGTLLNTGTTSGSASIASLTTQVPVLQSGWTTSTAAASASLTLTKPTNVEAGDLLLILVGNDDNTATAQWDDVSIRPTGFSMINEAGNNTPDTHVAAFYRIADGTETATTSVPAQSADNFWGFYIRVTGASTTNPIGAVGSDYAVNNLTNHPISGVTTVVNNALAFYMLAGDAVGTAPFSVSAGWTEASEITINTAGTWGTKALPTAGSSGNATVTMNASDGASGFQFAINPAVPYATIMSPQVDFSLLTAQATWGEGEWHTTEPGDSDVLFHVYYTSTTTCDTLVPDSALSGNSAGFTAAASPLSLVSLSTTTYSALCLKANLSLGTSITSPTLDDWTVRWQRTPQYTQSDYYWYANTNDLTPSDAWPSGVIDLDENDPISSGQAVMRNNVLRLRMSAMATTSIVSTSSATFKLQYGEGADCSLLTEWYDVGALGSTTALWRGYNNSTTTATDGATIPSTLLTSATVRGSYEEENNTASNPYAIPIGGIGEWDWVIENSAGVHGSTYCFRMVKSDGALFSDYTNYPTLVTNGSPEDITLYTPFDNEKLASTSPFFEFNAIDPESNDISYQIQIDDDYSFGSPHANRTTIANPSEFENLATPSDKDPYTNGERIRFSLPVSLALSNGTTYYWRVRGLDPSGSNEWGEWSVIQSLTVDTSVTVSTWFQTTEEQFDSDTHVGTDPTASDLVQLATGSTTGTTTSSAINFEDGSLGNAWGSLAWTDNETSSDLKYRLQYYDDANQSWEFIPASSLSGNDTGFDTSPISLLDLNTDTYTIIRIVAVFTNSGASPTLSDWTVAWGYRIETPTLTAPFRNEKVSTTTPTFEFYTSDPQSDDLAYEIQWSASSSFAASTTRTSSTSAGFVNTENGGDTSPFTSGNVIQFTIQTGDALTNGRTYWWRVRAIDPFGSIQYSFYSDPQSFTVDTSVTVSTWFQTTAEQFVTNTLSGATTTGSSSVTVASTSVESLMVYAEGTVQTPRYRVWDGSVWGSEGSALSVGSAITWAVLKAHPSENEYVMATMGTDADVNVQVYTNGSWDNLQEITTAIPNTNMRGFDVAYEQLSGDALAVTCDGDSIASYWIWNGTTWTNYGDIGSVLGNTCGWVKLISDPISDEIIAVVRNTTGTRYEARVWSGASWGNSVTMGSMAQPTHEGIAAEYEDSGNQAVVAVSNGGNSSFQWRAWNGTTATWTATATVALGDDFEAGTMRADDGTDNMVFCYVDEDGDIGAQRWTGAGFAAGVTEFNALWNTAGNIYNDRPVDCMFETNGTRNGYIMGVYASSTGLASSTYVAAWTASQKISPSMSPSGVRVQLARTGTGLIQVLSYASTTDRYEYTDWNGSSWSTVQILESDGAAGATPFKEPFMMAPKNPVTSGTVVGDPLGIDFYSGSGPYWQQMSWNDTTSGGSDILYQVEYYDGDSWELISDTLIPGNSVGTTTSPINLTNVLPVATYNLIRPVATLTCNVGTCPILHDWTITWSPGITISGTADTYDETSDVTAGTVAVALNGTLQIGKTGSISGGVWSIANVNASPGDIVTVFINGVSDVNEAVAVARYDGVGDMSGMRLYEHHLTVGSNDATSTVFTNADLGLYDYQNDEDIFFNATTTILDLCVEAGCADAELYVMASTTYRPTGTSILDYFENNGTTTLDGNIVYVGRSWDNNATVTAGTSTVIFTATSTSETINETGALSPSFYNLTFGTTTGNATWTPATNIDVNNTLTISRGVLARGTTTLTIGGSFTIETNGVLTGMGTTTFDGTGTSNFTDNSSSLQNIGRVVIDGTSKTVQLGNNARIQSLTIGADDIFDISTGNFTLTLLTHFINNNTYLARSGTTTFAGTTTNLTITPGGDAFYNLAFTGAGGAWSFTESTLSVGGNFIMSTGTVTLPTGTTTISGSFDNATGTFAHNNSVVVFNGSGTRSVRQSGSDFTNAFYDVVFAGSGTYTFLDTRATTTNNFSITSGSVTLPSTLLTIGGSFLNTAGTFSSNSGTVKVSGSGLHSIDTNASFYNLLFDGTGTTTFVDTSVTASEDVTILGGVVTFPSNTFTIGGSIVNQATVLHASGTVLMNSSDTGETVSLGSSPLAHLVFNSGTGGWTITESATTTGSTTLTSVGQFTVNPGVALAVGGVFTNTAVGASTTWTGSILALISGTSYSINTKTNTPEIYGTLLVGQNTDIKMWNATATTYAVDTTGSLYSQDHNAQDGSLYIFGEYMRTSGSEYWNYSTDFDGTSLGTSSARQVSVRFASSSSATFSSSTLSVVGTTTATTSIDYQGVGTYTLRVVGGTTTLQYFDMTNYGTYGITLASSTRVTTISDGRFVPTLSGSSGFMVSSTSIDANPALQIFRMNFSTSTAISAVNVRQGDGSPTSYWWFRNSTGTFDGESFDNDTGDPGSVRWDDSSLTITVSGTVYDADGSTPLGLPTCGVGGTPVRVVVENGGIFDGACDGSGNFSIPGVTIVGDPTLTIFLNGAPGGERGTIVTKTPTTDISGLRLIVNRTLLRHEDTSAMSIDDMLAYDSTDDSDVLFTAATGTLTTYPNTGLVVSQGKTFTPDGSVTLMSSGSGTVYDGSLYLEASSTFTGSATTTYSLGGSFFQYASSTFVPASSTVFMTATTTGKTFVSSSSESIAFHNLSFTGVGGGWNVNGNIRATGDILVSTGTVSGTGNITLTQGSFYGNGLVSLGGGTTTLAASNTLGGTTAWTFYDLTLGTGSTTGTTSKATTATTTVGGRLTIGTGHFFNAFGSTLHLTGSSTVFVENGTFVESTSTVRYGGTSGSNVLSTTYYNLEVNGSGGTPTFTGTGLGIVVSNNLTVGGTGMSTFTLDTNDPALDVNGAVRIESSGTFVASNSAVCTLGGNYDNDGTFTSSGGTVTFDGSGVRTLAPGASSFGNVTASGTGSYTITESATTTGIFRLVTLGGFTMQSGTTLAVGTTFVNGIGGAGTTWTGSTLYLYGGGNYLINGATTSDSYETLTLGSGTQIRMWNSSAGTYDLSSTASLYSQDHGGTNGLLHIYGAYVKTSGTDYWSYATDYDGSSLSGGSERQSNVRIVSGGSVLFTGGGLSIIGSSTATTTIDNQGSGSYGVRIGGTASTTMSHYSFDDMDGNGLTFSGTPNVVNLSNGSFTVSVASGTAITVGGTVINQNPARTFTTNAFGTSTGGLAFNVTATGTTASSWRFTNHAGVIDGEGYDVDPDGDPGYVVWDDSAASLSFSGRVYSDEGSTVSSVCDGSLNITLRVAGLTSYTTNCNGGTGLYSFSGITYSPGDSFVIYIDGETEQAAVVSEDPVTSIANLDLYENRVIVRHEGADPLSISDMAIWDSSDDADIPFTAVDAGTDTLTLPANRKLLVWDSKEFEPNGNVTLSGGGGGASYDGTLELMTNATFDATGSETHAIGGSLVLGSGAVLDDDTSTFTFTTSGAGRTIDTNEYSFYNLTLNGSGSWTVTNNALEVGNTVTITQGALTLPSGTSTIGGSFNVTGGSFVQNGGSMYFVGSGAHTIRTGSSAFGTTTFGGSGTWTYQGTHSTSTGNFLIASGTVVSATGTLTLGNNFVNNGTFTHSGGTLRFISSLASTTITSSSSDLGSVVIAGSGTFVFTDPTEALAGTLTLLSGTTSLPTSTLSIAGSFISQGGAYVHSTGTILFNSSDVGESITPGSGVFNNVSIAAPSGGYTITGNATTTGNFSLTSATSFTLLTGQRLTVNGTFTNLVGGAPTTWTGSTLTLLSGTNYTANTKASGGDVYNIIALGNNTDLRLWNSSATTTLLDSLSSLYSQNNAGVNGELYIYGNYTRTTGADYWSATTDFDGAALGSRAVTVRHAAGATSTFSGGTLEIIGTPTATTTITNQTSGTYSFNITGGTLNAQYYAIRNADAYGLTLSGTTTVTSLDSGDYELGVSGGALITISSTTLNYNASAVISGLRFATTTAITGVNVALIGTTPSAWTFTNHRGNLDGEAFDSDGGDDCGSVRWDDSTCLLTEQSGYRWRNDDGGEGVPNTEWFDLSWSKRKRITITNTDTTDYTNAVVEVTIPYDSDMQSDFDDLRVTDSSGTTSLDFTRETYTASTEATLWIQVPSLPGNTGTEVYVYYGNGGVTYAGVGTTTFAVYDDFEDDANTEYSGDTSLFDTDTTFAAQGQYGLEATNPNGRATDGIFRTSASSTVSQGETIRFMQYVDTTAGSGDETCTLFGVQSPGTANNNYAVCLEQFGTDRVSISENVDDNDTSGTILASTTITYTTGWYEVEIDWTTTNAINVFVYKDDVLVATTSATDSSYTTGGFGFTFWFQNGGWDYFTARTLLTTEPTTTLGAEQVSGGASWAAPLNTALPGVDVGTIVRPRFLIENTGLTVNDSYRLMYAAKGASPSCESVSSGSYAAVPPQASCGSSPLCMQSSTYFTNTADTTDVLGGSGTFTPGEIIEDPSNTTNALTLNPDEFTEVEYAIETTVNAIDPSYCLRVSDAGTAIDSYTKVAELPLVFEPSISSVTFNDGNDITLTPGATTTVYATGTVTDLNGYTDIAHATATLYRSGVGSSCSANQNNCYIAATSSCTYTSCSGNSCNIVCQADYYYFADPTDTGSPYDGESWGALFSVADQGGLTASQTAPFVELLTLQAFDTNSLINYGSLAVSENTGGTNATTTFTNLGNQSIDILIEGTNLSDGVSSVIPVSEQIFATSTFTYSACTYCTQLATTSIPYELDLPKPTTTAPGIADDVFWGIEIPFGVSANTHTGANIFYATGD